MNDAILREKSHVRSSHARFDVGKSASEKPRRESLLYKKLVLSIAVLCAALSLFAEIVHTAADGTTFDVTGSVLTITVPSGQTQSSYDYVANILNQQAISAVVKDGAGTLVAQAAENYTGTWLVSGGVVDVSVGTAFGAASAQPGEENKVTVADGASVMLSAATTALDNRLVEIAGSGTAGSAGAICFSAENFTPAGTRFLLTADANIDFRRTTYVTGTIDVNGHNLTVSGGLYTNNYLGFTATGYGLVFTNGAETAASLVTPNSDNHKQHLTPVFTGGSDNVCTVTGRGRTYFEGLITADWTLSFLSGALLRGSRTAAPSANYGWLGTGPIRIAGTLSVTNPDNYNAGYGCTLKGSSLTGSSTPKLVVSTGAWLSLDIPEIDFPGDLDLQGGGDSTYRCQIRFQKGTPYLVPANKTTTVRDSDIWMDSETVRQLSPISISSGTCAIIGGAEGSTIPSIVVTGGATSVLETPAEIAAYTLSQGILRLGETMPAITRLACAAGTTVDLNGKDLAVGTFSGAPTVLNVGTISAETWELDVANGTLYGSIVPTIPAESQVVVCQSGGNLPLGRMIVAYFPAGTVLPDVSRFTARVAADCKAAFSIDTVQSGPDAGKVEIAVDVSPWTPPPAETIVTPDGTELKAGDQLLTVTVPTGVTSAYDYSSLVTAHYVTNIVKKGEGTLQACSLPSYGGDITIEAGYFSLAVADGLGARNQGVTRVLSGGSLAVTGAFADGAVAYETIELAGAGPDGRGAIRGSVTSSTAPLQNMTYYLTGDAMWLNDSVTFKIDRSTIDVAGHTLTIRGRKNYAEIGYFNGCTITNSIPDSPGKVMSVGYWGAESAGAPKFYVDGAAWTGGSQNALDHDYRVYIGKCEGDWTLPLNGLEVWGYNPASDVSVSDANYWAGTLLVQKDSSLQNNEGVTTTAWRRVSNPYPFSVMGPIRGAADKTLTFDTAVHLFSGDSDFQGTVKVTGKSINDSRSCMSRYFRNGLWLHDGAVLSCGADKPVQFDDADLWFADGSELRMPAMQHASGDLWITGGAKGDSDVPRPTIASIEKTSEGGLYIASPVVVAGTLSVKNGLLSLGTNGAVRTAAELPVFSNLVFAAGTTFDLDGNALEIPNLAGATTASNAGTITLTDTYTMSVDGTFATDGALAFASGAKVVVPKGTRLHGACTVLTAQGGIIGVPEIDAPDKFWEVRVEGNSVVIEHNKGVMLIVR